MDTTAVLNRNRHYFTLISQYVRGDTCRHYNCSIAFALYFALVLLTFRDDYWGTKNSRTRVFAHPSIIVVFFFRISTMRFRGGCDFVLQITILNAHADTQRGPQTTEKSHPSNAFAYFFGRSKFANVKLSTGAMFFH